MTIKRFQAIFQQSALAIQIYDREGFTVDVNDAWEKLFASRRSELVGYNVFQDPQVIASGVADCLRRCFAGEVVHVPPSFYDPGKNGKEGRARWLEAILSPVKNDQGEVEEVTVIFNDITDLKLARDHLKIIFENVAEGIMVQDRNFNVTYANKTAARMAGFASPEDWMSKKALVEYHEYLREDGSPFPFEELPSRRVLRGEILPGETIIKFRNTRTGEVKTSSVSSRAICDDSGTPVEAVSLFRDITDKLRIDTELRDALRSKDLFFSVASHEFRTPMTALKLNSQLIQLTYPQISMESISKMDRQVNKLSKLVDEMLDISRISRGRLTLRKKEMNLAQLTREVVFGMMDQLKLAGMPVNLNLPDKVMGNWDPDRLEQVIENLITNAIRYAKKSPLYVKVSADEKSAYLEVCDQGPGIPPEHQQQIFNQFERLGDGSDRGGLGLGLFIVKEIVTLHGGNISVSNLNTGGARFLIDLPLRTGP